ncbi:MAG: hypothetical protein MZV64_24140 [Ignavibacteriales bacterium]|nr:hypothetical protein [Ignavibacteriales bacterium]
MPEQHRLVLPEKSLADEVDHPCRGTSRVDGVEQKTFMLRKQIDRFALRLGQRRRSLLRQ